MEQNTTSRRRFFIHVGQMLGLAALAPVLFSAKALAEEKRRARPTEGGAAGGAEAGLTMVEPGKGAGAAVNYVLKHSDVKDAALKIERGGLPFEKQLCTNCGFYAKHSVKNGEEVGKCQIFPNQLVKGSAWCASWNKKA
jgi:ribosomal protein S27AE